MGSCQCEGIEHVFDEPYALKKLSNYRRSGPDDTTRMLVDALKAEGVEGLTLLDIGGGVGVVEHELLAAGLRHATDVDVSPAYLAAAQAEAQRRGETERITYHQGDFVALAETIPPADIVTLDRVICCYHDMETLVGLSTARARSLYGVVYPRDSWWVKVAFALENFVYRLQRNPFRAFVYPTTRVEAAITRTGLKRSFYHRTLLWQVVVYSR